MGPYQGLSTQACGHVLNLDRASGSLYAARRQSPDLLKGRPTLEPHTPGCFYGTAPSVVHRQKCAMCFASRARAVRAEAECRCDPVILALPARVAFFRSIHAYPLSHAKEPDDQRRVSHLSHVSLAESALYLCPRGVPLTLRLFVLGWRRRRVQAVQGSRGPFGILHA